MKTKMNELAEIQLCCKFMCLKVNVAKTGDYPVLSLVQAITILNFTNVFCVMLMPCTLILKAA